MTQLKLQQLKNAAFRLAKELGLHCSQTRHFKKRFVGLDLRTKASWLCLIERLKELASGVVVALLLKQQLTSA